jgi:cytosine deaminase
MGSHDMLDVAHMAVHAAQMTGMGEIKSMFDAVTINPAKTMHLDHFGLLVGKSADFVILQAKSVFDAVRLRSARLYVVRRGNVIATTSPVISEVKAFDSIKKIDFNLQRDI